MGQSMREGAIVGEKEQPFGIHVEATDREDAWFNWHQFDHGGTTLRIVSRRNHTGRLVEQVVDQTRFDTDCHAIDCDVVGISIDTPSEISDRSIDGDTAVSDQVLTDTTATDSDSCENLLQPLAIIGR